MNGAFVQHSYKCLLSKKRFARQIYIFSKAGFIFDKLVLLEDIEPNVGYLQHLY